MAERLSPLDVSFLYLEEATTPMHVGSVMVLDPGPGGLTPERFERLVRHVEARIAFVPRYRQRVRWVPARLANPVWVDDERFDVGAHVRRSALPRPGTREQLEELVARLQSRRLDRDRPLWELTVVEGLAGGSFAVVTKVHQALVDGVQGVDLAQVVLDDTPDASDPPAPAWRPAPEPSLVELVAGAVADSVRRPQEVLDTVRAGVDDVRDTAGRAAEALAARAAGGLAVVARTATRPPPRGPLNRDIGSSRRFATVDTDLEDHRRIRAAHAARAAASTAASPVTASVNDVVLATLTGALRTWLLARGEPVRPDAVVRALVPLSVRAPDADPGRPPRVPTSLPGTLGGRVSSLLVDLPTGEPSPVVRLHQIAYQTRAHREAGQAVDARALAGIAGFAPPTLHSLGARVASGLSRRLFNLVVTNVPGPQQPLWAGGSRMLSTYPVVPLARGQALAVGVTSYDGGVYYGLNGDREAMPDLAVLGQCVRDALAELGEALL